MIDTSKMIRYPCQCGVSTCTKMMQLVPHHFRADGLLLLSDENGAKSVILTEPALSALWNAMSDYMVDRVSTEEDEENA